MVNLVYRPEQGVEKKLDRDFDMSRINSQSPSRFVLLRFIGSKDDRREMFDAYVVDARDGCSFPITEGYDEIEVYAEPVKDR